LGGWGGGVWGCILTSCLKKKFFLKRWKCPKINCGNDCAILWWSEKLMSCTF
jgi:hypothetical protein